jgi:hypothetical protein
MWVFSKLWLVLCLQTTSGRIWTAVTKACSLNLKYYRGNWICIMYGFHLHIRCNWTEKLDWIVALKRLTNDIVEWRWNGLRPQGQRSATWRRNFLLCRSHILLLGAMPPLNDTWSVHMRIYASEHFFQNSQIYLKNYPVILFLANCRMTNYVDDILSTYHVL